MSINPNNRQKGPIINNQFNKPIMNINDGRNTFTNNINVKKLVNYYINKFMKNSFIELNVNGK